MALNIKECVGIKTQKVKKNDQEKTATTIYYIEPFPDDDGVVGMMTGSLFTYHEIKLKTGDKFKALYDKALLWDADQRKFVDRPVLAEIQVVKPGV